MMAIDSTSDGRCVPLMPLMSSLSASDWHDDRCDPFHDVGSRRAHLTALKNGFQGADQLEGVNSQSSLGFSTYDFSGE